MRRMLLVLAMFVFCLGAYPQPAAAAEWCDTDPLVLIATPGGALVPVFVTSGALGLEHLPAVLLAAISYTAEPTANGAATDVEIRVLVPGDLFSANFPTRTVASTGPLATGAIYARAEGRSNRVMVLRFVLPVP